MRARTTSLFAVLALAATGALVVPADATPATRPAPSVAARTATSVGLGGGVSSVDPAATRVGLRVLKKGGNAVDAAVATAAALGVTEPYSAGIGGGGYFVFYNADKGKVQAIDGRETAPAGIRTDAFIDPATGKPYNFTPELVTSGVSVGVPGTPATWDKALRRWGTWRLDQTLKPAIKLADRGFLVDQTFNLQTAENQKRFEAFPSTSEIYLPGGAPPAVGSVLKNPDLADTYRLLADKGVKKFYQGKLAGEIARDRPEAAEDGDHDAARAGRLDDDGRPQRLPREEPQADDGGLPRLRRLRHGAVVQRRLDRRRGAQHPRALRPRRDDRRQRPAPLPRGVRAGLRRPRRLRRRQQVRGRPAGRAARRHVRRRAGLQDQRDRGATKPVAAGNPASYDGSCATPAPGTVTADADTENISTTNLTVSDRWGNVVEYTLTIEQTGGSGIVVPGRGFILNNELTDFSTTYSATDPNRIQPGKRPRSSMSPTIVLKDDEPWLALGSPGGSTIITTVLQMLVNRIDRGMTIQQAIAAPRAAQRNTASVTAEQSFIDAYGVFLTPLGHTFAAAGAPGTSAAEIGAATAIEFGPDGRLTVVAEPVRRGGGAAGVVVPR